MEIAKTTLTRPVVRGRVGRYCAMSIIAALLFAHGATAQIAPVTTCDMAGIGSVTLVADGPPVTIREVSTGTAGTGDTAVPYCLVKVLVPQAINIWVGLPMEGKWNGRLQSLGGGGYAGSVSVPTAALTGGYVGITTDTGHVGGDGSFGMLSPGVPNTPLQIDFAYRSEHLMAVIGKQLTQAFYGQKPIYSYWNGCSTGGRQGLMMAQRYPEDYEGILAGAPAIHWDRFQAAQIWPQMVMFRDNGGAVPTAKLNLATSAAVAACDAKDGVRDGVLEDPRNCHFDARALRCPRGVNNDTCLTKTEALAINKIWQGPVLCPPGAKHHLCDAPAERANGPFDVKWPPYAKEGRRLWYGLTRDASLTGLAGPNPFLIAVNQPRYWVYYDPTWDWHVLDYDNYAAFFDLTVERVGPVIATDDPDLSRFRDLGSKLIIWHGWADPLIMPEGTVDYYDRVVKTLGEGYEATREFARLFMAPGVGHCGGGAGPQPQNLFNTLVNWVENHQAPETILASRTLPNGRRRTRPLCLYPEVAVWTGVGSTDDAANFVCK